MSSEIMDLNDFNAQNQSLLKAPKNDVGICHSLSVSYFAFQIKATNLPTLNLLPTSNHGISSYSPNGSSHHFLILHPEASTAF